MIVPVMAISNLVLTRQIYSEQTNGAHAYYREPVPLRKWNQELQLCVRRNIEHLGSLESIQEARVGLGCASSKSYASFVFSKLSARPQYLDIPTLTHKLIVK